MKKSITLFFLLFLFFTNRADAQQNNYILQLQSGAFVPEVNAAEYIDQCAPVADEIIEGYYHRMFQFYAIPNYELRKEMEATGLRFLEYIPNNTYIVALPAAMPIDLCTNWNLRSILPVPSTCKIDKSLLEEPHGEWAVRGDQLLIDLQYFKNISSAFAKSQCEQQGWTIVRVNPLNHTIKVWISREAIDQIATLPFVRYLSLAPEPPRPEDEPAVIQQRSNMVSSPFGNYGFDGNDINLCVRENYTVHSHIDFKGRINNDINIYNSTNLENYHTQLVAGVMGGSGNLNPLYAGVVPGATIYTLEAYNDFSGGDEILHTQEEVLITSTSLSDGCNAGYTQAAQAMDLLSNMYPQYLHVFSAGNANDDGISCGYGAGPYWGNITGGNKQGKNCIATGMLTQQGELHDASSRGPAYDGRIKPDLLAVGFTTGTDLNNTYQFNWGTSFASPGVAGAAAQLVQAYRTWNNGENPDAALVKAALLNTATDLGNPGPDFSHGWGQANVLRAIQLLEDNRYTEVTVDQGETQQLSISIPSGLEEARIMIYWNDPAAASGAQTALVNDVNMLLESVSGETYLPLVLDHTPDETNLNTPAVPGIDHLNNVEQVRLTTPQGGNYSLSISGDVIPMGPQKVFVLYEFINNSITITHPFGGESFSPGEEVLISWDAYGDEGDFIVEYSPNSGTSWEVIGEVSGQNRIYSWEVPDTVTGSGRIRISRDNEVSSGTDFSILGIPNNLEIAQACVDFLLVEWDTVPGATAYVIYKLGAKYMEVVDTTFSTSYALNIANPTDENWLSVSALGQNGAVSRRAVAIFYNTGLLDCVYDVDVSALAFNSFCSENFLSCTEGLVPISIQIQNTGLIAQTDIVLSYQINGNTPVTETLSGSLAPDETMEYTFDNIPQIQEGVNDISVWVSLPGDVVFFNDSIHMTIDMEYVETAPQTTDVTESFESADFPPEGWKSVNYDQSLGWEPITVTDSDGNPTTAVFMNNYDNFEMGQRDLLITYPVDLSGTLSPKLVFDLSYARYNASYADTFKISVTTICSDDCLHTEVYYKFSQDLATAPQTTSPFTPVLPSHWRKEIVDLSNFIDQIVYVTFENITGFGNNLYLDNIAFADFEPPLADFEYNELGDGIVEFNNTSTGTALYLWDFGNGQTSTVQNPQTTYSSSGNYIVTLQAYNDWCTDEATQTINITTVGINEISNLSDLILSPNPGKDDCSLIFQGHDISEYHWQWVNALGQSIQTGTLENQTGFNQMSWEMSEWPSGIYWLYLSDESQKRIVLKWVKQ